ncbi:4-aminobutyrate aminotransferase, mitochondrial-like isoform X2 [Paramacrobiotus metropolitanus]|nr:4-aminobutyrate aminotransferase, mitochondrial-like isoform X2 [Paramacrobiotus metropolitanus]
MQISTIALGYNHPELKKVAQSPEFQAMCINRPALGTTPPTSLVQRLHDTLLSVAPKGLHHVHTMACGSCANENAFKTIFMWYNNKLRDGKPYTEEELEQSLENKGPACPPLTMLAFQGGFHGRTFGCLAASHSRSYYKRDIPTLDWPTSPFPRYKYPVALHAEANRREDQRCLARVQELFAEYIGQGQPVAGVVVEPIQAEGGDNHASAEFFQQLQYITKKNGAALMFDEVHTGGGSTGSMWMHEQFNLDTPADVVSFSKKFMTGGYFYHKDLYVQEGFKIFNTWMGDPTKLILLEKALEVIRRDDLLTTVEQSAKILEKGLQTLQEKYPEFIRNSRGSGTLRAFDLPDAETTARFVKEMRNSGVQIGTSGPTTIRIRPALIFQPKHAQLFLDTVDEVLRLHMFRQTANGKLKFCTYHSAHHICDEMVTRVHSAPKAKAHN